MKNRIHTPAETPEELLSDLRTLVVEAQKLMDNSVTERSEEVITAVRARLEAAQQRLTGYYDDTKRKVVAGARYSDEVIREHPYPALAIALGVGVLAGVVIGRRSK